MFLFNLCVNCRKYVNCFVDDLGSVFERDFSFCRLVRNEFRMSPTFLTVSKSGRNVKVTAHTNFPLILRIHGSLSPHLYTPVVLNAKVACIVVICLFNGAVLK